jgi:hypothetical protein
MEPVGATRGDPRLQKLLEDRLGVDAAEVFVESVVELKLSLDKLRRRLRFDESMKVHMFSCVLSKSEL